MKTIPIISIMIVSAFAGFSFVQAQNSEKSAYSIYSFEGANVYADSIWHIRNQFVEYESQGSLHDYPQENVLRIKKGGQNYIIVADTLYPLTFKKMARGRQPFDTTWKYDPNINYSAMGAAHADMYVNGTGGFVTGFLLAPTIIFPLVVAAVPPRGPDHLVDKTIFNSVPEYKKAYQKRGSKIKQKGVLAGVATFAVLTGFIVLMATATEN